MPSFKAFITIVLVAAHIRGPSSALCFTVPSGDSPSLRKTGESNFRNEGDDMLLDTGLPQIIQDSRQRLKRTTNKHDDEHAQRYKRARRKNGENAWSPDVGQQLNQNSTLSLKLSELSEWANQGNGERTEAILTWLEDQGRAPRAAYLATIRAWLVTDRVDEALNVIARMETSKFRVKAADYRPILQAFIKIGQPNGAIRLLNHMAKCKTGRPILADYDFEDPKRRKTIWSVLSCSELPDERCLMIVCNEFVKKKLPDRMKVVIRIFEWAKEHKRADNYLFNVALGAFDDPRDTEKFLLLHADASTHAICYMTVMQAYYKHPFVYKRGTKMESLLRRMQNVEAQGAIQPDLVTYLQIMQAYLGDKDSVEAAKFLKKAFDDVQSGRIKDSPHSKSLFLSWSKSVIDKVAKSDLEIDGTRLILDVIQWIEQFLEGKGDTLSIDFYHFVMDNYIRAKGPLSIQFVEILYARIHAKYRLSRKIELLPNSKTLNIVLKAYCKSRDVHTMEKAEGILIFMEETYQKERNSINCIVPDVISYSTVIQGWASCRCPDAIIRADKIAKRLNKMHRSGNEAAKPDHGVEIAVLNAKLWNGPNLQESGGRRTPIDDHQIMALVYANPPDLVSLTKLIKNWESSDAGAKAEDIIDRLLTRYEESQAEEVLPDSTLFTAAIGAWGRSQLLNAGVRAEGILNRIVLLYDLTRSERMKPNGQHFIAVIRAYSQPSQPEKAQNAIRVFDEMMKLYDDGVLDGVPNREAFTAVLKACSHAKGISYEKKPELDIVHRIYTLICSGKYCNHNEATYGAYIGAIRNCMERGELRKSVMKSAFDRCCNDGFVDGFIIGQLRRSLSHDEFQDVVGHDVSEMSPLHNCRLPQYWGRNIIKR